MTTATHLSDQQAKTRSLSTFSLPVELTPEHRLLLLCARQELTPVEAIELTALLDQRLDWETAVHDARWHKLSGFMYQHLHNAPYARRLPEGVLAAVKGDYARNTARYLYYRTELVRIVRQLNEASIPVIALKGSALMRFVYTSPGVRPMADIDLLVPDADVHRAHDIVKGMGYRAAEDDSEDPRHWELHQHLPILIGLDRAVAVEVHRHVVRKDSALAFNIDDFWSRAKWTDFDGVPVRVLAPEDLLLHLAVNFFRDRRFYSLAALSQLTDIAEVCRFHARSEGIDWATLRSRARNYGIDGPVACALTLAAGLVDAPVPSSTVGSMWPREVPTKELAVFASERVLACRSWTATELVPAGKAYGLRSLIGATLRRLFPSRAHMTKQYGQAGVAVYARHVGQRLPGLLHILIRPWSIGGELTVDRWMHSLYRKPPTAADMTDD